MEEWKTIALELEDDHTTEFYVLEQVQLMGVCYYLVSPKEAMDAGEDGEDTEAYILREQTQQDSEYALYEFVDEEEELETLFPIFEELLAESEMEVEL